MTTAIAAALRAGLAWTLVTSSLVLAGLTATPAATAAPSEAAGGTYTVRTSVNVRSGPSQRKAVLALLQPGQQVQAGGPASGDWLPIRYAGKTAYAWAAYLKPDPATAKVITAGPAGQKLARAKAAVRAEANPTANRLTTLAKGATATITGLVSGAFSQVRIGQQVGWVATTALGSSLLPPGVLATMRTTTKMTLRANAAPAATGLRTIAKGELVGISGVHAGAYSQVTHRGRAGWLLTGELEPDGASQAGRQLPLSRGVGTVTAAPEPLLAAPRAAAQQVALLDEGTRLRLTGATENGFTEAIWDGSTSWIDSGRLQTTSATPPPAADDDADLGTPSLNKLQAPAKAAVRELRPLFPEVKTIHGWRASSAYSSDHPNGRAIDLMIPAYRQNQELGDRIAEYVIANGARLGVNYVIWRQRSYAMSRGSWKAMADRGGDTANHFDHVHVSFHQT